MLALNSSYFKTIVYSVNKSISYSTCMQLSIDICYHNTWYDPLFIYMIPLIVAFINDKL